MKTRTFSSVMTPTIVGTLLLGTLQCFASPTFQAAATLTSQKHGVPNFYYATSTDASGHMYAVVPLSASGESVTITGAGANQMFNVVYSLQVNSDGTAPANCYDGYNGLVSCDANGRYQHLANGSGSLSGNVNSQIGGHTATAVAGIYDQNNSANTASMSDSLAYSVLKPGTAHPGGTPANSAE